MPDGLQGERPASLSGAALDAAIDGGHRSGYNEPRDRYRHPNETLELFGFRKDMTVVEIWPGGTLGVADHRWPDPDTASPTA